MDKGKLFLIPSVIGKDTQKLVLAPNIIQAIKDIDIFIVENIRTGRRHIKKIDNSKNINKTTFFSIGKYQDINLERDLLRNILSGKNIGLLSDAGLPCIADPGSKIVLYAHEFQIDIVPLVGPSSIFLALMASGLNGQKFKFNGYLPIKKNEKIKAIRQLDNKIKKTEETQIFIETPFRNNQLLESILSNCSNTTKLCIASNITMNNEQIKTQTISEWKTQKININKSPTIFLLG